MNKYYLLALCVGICTGPLLSFFGIMNGIEAVDYYAEVHQSGWNSWIHTLFMPFTFLGMTISIPAIFNLKDPYVFQTSFFIWYIIHYIMIDPIVGLCTFLLYYPVLLIGNEIYRIIGKNGSFLNCFVLGVSISIVALIIQEYFGHYMGGDEPSRPEGVLNAILYAKYYSIYHILH